MVAEGWGNRASKRLEVPAAKLALARLRSELPSEVSQRIGICGLNDTIDRTLSKVLSLSFRPYRFTYVFIEEIVLLFAHPEYGNVRVMIEHDPNVKGNPLSVLGIPCGNVVIGHEYLRHREDETLREWVGQTAATATGMGNDVFGCTAPVVLTGESSPVLPDKNLRTVRQVLIVPITCNNSVQVVCQLRVFLPRSEETVPCVSPESSDLLDQIATGDTRCGRFLSDSVGVLFDLALQMSEALPPSVDTAMDTAAFPKAKRKFLQRVENQKLPERDIPIAFAKEFSALDEVFTTLDSQLRYHTGQDDVFSFIFSYRSASDDAISYFFTSAQIRNLFRDDRGEHYEFSKEEFYYLWGQLEFNDTDGLGLSGYELLINHSYFVVQQYNVPQWTEQRPELQEKARRGFDLFQKAIKVSCQETSPERQWQSTLFMPLVFRAPLEDGNGRGGKTLSFVQVIGRGERPINKEERRVIFDLCWDAGPAIEFAIIAQRAAEETGRRKAELVQERSNQYIVLLCLHQLPQDLVHPQRLATQTLKHHLSELKEHVKGLHAAETLLQKLDSDLLLLDYGSSRGADLLASAYAYGARVRERRQDTELSPFDLCDYLANQAGLDSAFEIFKFMRCKSLFPVRADPKAAEDIRRDETEYSEDLVLDLTQLRRGPSCAIRGHKAILLNIVLNLLQNAIKNTTLRHVRHAKVKSATGKASVELRVSEQGLHIARLEVRDCGAGVGVEKIKDFQDFVHQVSEGRDRKELFDASNEVLHGMGLKLATAYLYELGKERGPEAGGIEMANGIDGGACIALLIPRLAK